MAVLTAALLLSGASTIAFVAPVAFQRRHFRTGRKDALVWASQCCSIAGLLHLAAAMLLSVWLVLAFLWSATLAWAMAVALTTTTFAAWFVAGSFLKRA